LEFLRLHTGFAIGAALGAAFGFMAVTIPLIGHFIALTLRRLRRKMNATSARVKGSERNLPRP